MGEWSQRYMARIRERWTFELDGLGVAMVEDVRDRISVPVEYVGDYVIRSSPGEPPRKEFGNLWGSCEHTVDNQPALTVMAGGPSAPYAKKLEYGDGAKLKPRPYFGPLRAHWTPMIGPRLIESLQGL
jgi:hypothetical protein